MVLLILVVAVGLDKDDVESTTGSTHSINPLFKITVPHPGHNVDVADDVTAEGPTVTPRNDSVGTPAAC